VSLLPHEVFASLKQKRKKADKVQFLKDNENWALKDIIRGSMDPTVNGTYQVVMFHTHHAAPRRLLQLFLERILSSLI